MQDPTQETVVDEYTLARAEKIKSLPYGYNYDANSGWVIKNGAYYELMTLRKYDAGVNLLVDEATGAYYSMQDPNMRVNADGTPYVEAAVEVGEEA